MLTFLCLSIYSNKSHVRTYLPNFLPFLFDSNLSYFWSNIEISRMWGCHLAVLITFLGKVRKSKGMYGRVKRGARIVTRKVRAENKNSCLFIYLSIKPSILYNLINYLAIYLYISNFLKYLDYPIICSSNLP